MFACALLAVSAFAAEDWRGNNRLQGTVVDKGTGKPVAGAKVKLRKGPSGPDATADANGKWAILGISAGHWNIDVEAQGYETKQGSVGVGEGARVPALKIEIEPMAAPAPAATQAEAPVEEVKIGGVAVTPEIAAAVEAGNKLVGEQKYTEAIAEYEKAYPTLSSNVGLKLALARAYYGAGQLKKAIVLMDEAYKADPQPQTGVLLANMLVEDGQADRAKEIVEKLPTGSITDPMIYVNMGIAAMNKKQPAIAVGYFGKAIEMDPKRFEGYYYRGLASIQMGKAKDGKPDLQKVIELAPNSDEAKEAKEYLKSIK
jgi:tetratricopeptide (TPR) repeat protein